jgi:hypothetical protein
VSPTRQHLNSFLLIIVPALAGCSSRHSPASDKAITITITQAMQNEASFPLLQKLDALLAAKINPPEPNKKIAEDKINNTTLSLAVRMSQPPSYVHKQGPTRDQEVIS